jgi:Ca2+-transporting ATPase
MLGKWHAISLNNVFTETKSNNNGISSEEALKRIKEFGHNILPQEKPYSKIRLFLDQFNNSLMYILSSAVVISFFLKHYSDALFIVIVLLINTIVGFYQENKANNSLSVLKKMVKIRAKVLRDGYKKEIDSEELVPGDIIMLKAGDKIPADGRIIESKDFKVDEASLTGESDAVKKEAIDLLPKDAPIHERKNLVFMDTIVQEGQATIVVVETGVKTQIGQLVVTLKKTKDRRTPLQQKIDYLSKVTSGFILSIIFVIIVIGYFTEKSFVDIFITALALAVSAIPEGLLPGITVILVLGMRRILKKKGLVRKLVSTETLGSVTVICTDKTGTLTEGKMQVSHILTNTRELMGNNISGLAKGEKSNGVESHILALKIATLVNDAFVENPDEELKKWIVRGKLTDQALLMAGLQAGLSKIELEKQYPIIDRIIFESEIKYAATLHSINRKKNKLYVIGAPEKIIGMAVSLDIDGKKKKLNKIQRVKLIEKLELLTKKGLRVIACAYRDCNSTQEYQNLKELVGELTLVGFIAIKDPLRKDAKSAIAITKKAGIRTIIVTGDHRLTAKTIAEEIGIDAHDENILEGKDLELIDDLELRKKARHVSIYARVSPHHKIRIVEALQANGEIVAMLGDGVNDALALKSADIGVAVGSGSDVAKEVADLVLLDDNFKTIVEAIEQGRVVFQNIRKIFVYLIADDFSELCLFLISISMGLPLPLLPAQILWINLVEDGLPDIALTTEQETEGVMEEKPKGLKEPMLNKPIKLWMLSVFFITGIASFLIFFITWKITGDLEKTRTIVFALMCLDSLSFSFSVRSFKKTVFRKDIFSNRYLTGAVIVSLMFLVVAIYWLPLQKILSTTPLNLTEWTVIIAVTLLEVLLISFTKKKIFVEGALK